MQLLQESPSRQTQLHSIPDKSVSVPEIAGYSPGRGSSRNHLRRSISRRVVKWMNSGIIYPNILLQHYTAMMNVRQYRPWKTLSKTGNRDIGIPGPIQGLKQNSILYRAQYCYQQDRE